MRPEASLQAAWLARSSGQTYLTSDAEAVRVVQAGVLNRYDGPDFEHCEFLHSGKRLLGAAELHRNCSDWYAHGHHEDARYDQVVLHICTTPDRLEPVVTRSGRCVPSLFFPAPEASQVAGLLCTPFWSSVPADVFHRQLSSSKGAYLTRMVDRLAAWIPAGSGPLRTMRHVFIGGASGLLGGPANRDLLEFHARTLLGIPTAGLPPAVRNRVRPGARATVRVSQLEAFDAAIRSIVPESLLSSTPAASWLHLTGTLSARPGPETLAIVYQLVWVPALLLTGILLRDTGLQLRAAEAWSESEHPVPASIARQFNRAPVRLYQNTGLVYQAKYVCAPGGCSGCQIFKHISMKSVSA